MVPGSYNEAFAPSGTFRSGIYRLLWSAIGLLERASYGCLCLAAGLLREQDLRAAADGRWMLYPPTDDSVDAGLDVWEARVYFSVLRDSDRVLLVGCGGGRDLLPLCARGFDVTGLERVPVLVEAARHHLARRGLMAKLIAAPVETAEIESTFDVVIFSALVYGYVRGSARHATLVRLRSHLSPGGRLVVSYAESRPQSPLWLWLIRTSGWLTRSDWTAEAGDRFVPGPLHRRLPFYERALSVEGVRRELTAAGFQVLRDEPAGPWRCAVASPTHK